jgi:hypothetical protein
MTTKRSKRDPYTRTVVRLPERALSESILHLAAPLLDPPGPAQSSDEVHRALELAIKTWNVHVMASPLWGRPRPKPLADLRRTMPASSGLAESFALLSARWRTEFSLDPRLVGEWSFEETEPGRRHLVCRTALPEGVEAEVPPPAEKRIAIAGRFLDEVRIHLGGTSFLSFPVENHRGDIHADGAVTVEAKMPTVVALFADGALKPVGGAPVDVRVGSKVLGPMVLREVGCSGRDGHNDVAVLVFRPSNAEAGS